MHGAYFITAFEIFVFTLKMINSNDRPKYIMQILIQLLFSNNTLFLKRRYVLQ